MKTNQLMEVKIGKGVLHIEHKTQMGNMDELWELGNVYRVDQGLDPLSKTKKTRYLRTIALKEYVNALEKRKGMETTEFTKDATATSSKLFKVKKAAHKSSTFAHLYILIDMAMNLSAEFKLDVVDTFINAKILKIRDDGGDSYKEMSRVLDITLNAKDHQALMQKVSMAIRHKIFGKTYDQTGRMIYIPDIWNTKYVNAQQLKQRDDIQNFVANAAQAGLLTNYEQVIKIIQSFNTK